MDLSGFSAFDFSEGVPYFSVTLNGLTFNRSVVLKLALRLMCGFSSMRRAVRWRFRFAKKQRRRQWRFISQKRMAFFL